MFIYKNSKVNPNPISKFIVLILMSFTVTKLIHTEILMVFVFCIFFFINDHKKFAIKSFLIFLILYYIPNFEIILKFPFLVKIVLGFLLLIRMFYLPYLAGSFLVRTSDVSSIINSLGMIKVPRELSIPLAVMFRFFPSFKEEHYNIKTAMKIRGISKKNIMKYLEYVFVPLIILSANLADDISKAAECKAISNPCKKTRYFEVKFKLVDFIYLILFVILFFGGILWLK